MVHDLIVVGAGVWGMSAAQAALRSGARSVLLIEKNIGVAQESSAKSGGILTDLLWHPADHALVARSRELYLEARGHSGDVSVARAVGMLTLASGGHRAALARRAGDLRERGVRHELLGAPEVRRRHPALDRLPPDTLGLHTPDDWALNPTAYAQAAFDSARAEGLQVRFGCRVDRIDQRDGGIDVRAGKEVVRARRVLVAAGTWTRRIVASAGYDIPLLPYRVQASSVQFRRPHGLPIVWDVTTDVYLVPDGAVDVLAGDGTRLWEHDPDDYEATGDDAFLENIAERVPALTSLGDEAGLRSSWAGLCGGTPDRRPLLGPLGGGLHVAAGDQGIGVMRGPALGELAAQVALGEAEEPALRPDRHPPGPFELQFGFTLE